MITKVCLICKKEFKSFKASKRKYCSKECYYQAKSIDMQGEKHWNYQKIKKECIVCGTEIICSPSREERTKVCSLKCRYELQHRKRPDEHPNWKGGITINEGRVFLYTPHHPYATQRGYVSEHRLVMEKYLGRYLKPEEVVHHKNRNSKDNRIENLELFKNNKEHLEKTLWKKR